MAESQDTKVSFKNTLNLPTTDFPIRPNAKVDDPSMLARWESEDLYNKAFKKHEGNKKFILHDGPPYANGHLHLGHAYNNILKDIVTKSQRMFGKHVPVTPGWDCHGLPIELKVTQENPGLTGEELKKKCRAYATHWINVQRQERKDLGVIMDWDHPYATMYFDYEANILRAFGDFIAHGYIERKNKTVPWCPSDQTVLASAEIEHQERKDPSIYVKFSLAQATIAKIAPQLAGNQVSLLIWTTTPWTLPLNRAVTAKPDTMYAVIKIEDQYLVVAKELVAKIAHTVGQTATIVAEFNSNLLQGAKAHHPFIEKLEVPILLENSVSLEDGTAFVHCAPGCGPEDYLIGVKNNLEIFSPITTDGKYDQGIVPAELKGMSVADGNIWAIKKLAEVGNLFFKTSIRHAYPHCWRCHNALIFRATKQWFCDLEKHNLKEKALEAIPGIKMIPAKSEHRLSATLEGRLEWCLSRQRVWGVPIPALLCTNCDTSYITQEFVNEVADKVEEHGIEYWDKVTLQELNVPSTCPACNKQGTWVKELDILDVWFESGVSHYAVLLQNKELAFPADMYLEGKDQHRAWFQSSLLTGMVLEGEPPMRIIMTHGFTVDDKGRKMSKSLGNVVAPQELINKIGTDGLRLWASSIDCEGEAIVSDILLQNVQEVFRKVRNTCRFLLSNLYDYDHTKDAVALNELPMLDQYALEQLFRLNHEILKKYNDFDFTGVFHTLADYSAVELSAFYLDIIKDRLYTEKADGHARRSAQTVCWYMLDTLTRLMAPIMSFTAEQLSDHFQKDKTESIHLQKFTTLPDVWQLLGEYYAHLKEDFDLQAYAVNIEPVLEFDAKKFVRERDAQWHVLKEARSALLKAIEVQRERGLIKHSLEARLTIYFDMKHDALSVLNEFFATLKRSAQTREAFFKEFLIVSQVEFVESAQGLEESELTGMWVRAEHARGEKCPRCWQWEETTNEFHLCKRCQAIVK